MRIAIITCWGYRDCWSACLSLLDLYWPDHPPVSLLTDTYPEPFDFPSKVKPRVFVGEGRTWCERVASHAAYLSENGEPVSILMQEDMFLNRPVDTGMVAHGLSLLNNGVGLVRLYPSPPGIDDIGDPYFAEAPKGSPYRISCHIGFWLNSYLHAIANGANWTTGEARDFEVLGNPVGDQLPERVLAIREDVGAPVSYCATAVSRSLWNPEALRLCADHGIQLDMSLREVATG